MSRAGSVRHMKEEKNRMGKRGEKHRETGKRCAILVLGACPECKSVQVPYSETVICFEGCFILRTLEVREGREVPSWVENSNELVPKSVSIVGGEVTRLHSSWLWVMIGDS